MAVFQLISGITSINNLVSEQGVAQLTPALQQRYAQSVLHLGGINAQIAALLLELRDAKAALAPPPPPPSSVGAARQQATVVLQAALAVDPETRLVSSHHQFSLPLYVFGPCSLCLLAC